ncbi:DUF308 domain-containing protein [Phycicoccus endophyticus]|uniref:DUF308 domain-containing protein n=1 Tax=Phycicoccus endophyticus TaxID=1690220 RepID=A0A7G9R1Z8_9MICO|nr:DUF308 domain-containing protein [Phycicoccus endophyticus]NHI19746.1 HdeD family acid-resistance protein [Phycicoccus endophyticus]QNN49623.1 DUF308 domain-containing protein [Phycicoccus endophyticus]GGL33416.1 membrane protein [Phycicoccus endophyticus]
MSDPGLVPRPARPAWLTYVARGVVAFVVGVLAIVWPGLTIGVLGVVWGVWAIVDGVGLVGQAAASDAATWKRVLVLVVAAVATVAGIVAVFSPALAVTAVTWALGVWLAVRGIVEIVDALGSPAMMLRWLVVAGGIVSWLLGILLMANPGRGAVGIAIVLGLVAVVWGLLYVAVGLVLRSESAGALDGRPVHG